MLSAEIVAELRRLLAEATPVGDWRAVEGDLEGKPVSEYARTLFANRESDGTTSGRLFLTVAPNDIDPEKGAEVVPALTGNGPRSEANALLISAAINALPALLDAAEAARETTPAEVGLREAVEALASVYATEGAARDAAGKPAWPNNVARDLRALLAEHPAPTPEAEVAAGERECRYPCGCDQFADEHCACMDGHATPPADDATPAPAEPKTAEVDEAICTPMYGSCALLSGHVGPHHGYPENIAALLDRERRAERECLRLMRAEVIALADSIHGEAGWEHNSGCEGESDCHACVEEDLRRIARADALGAAGEGTGGAG